MSVHRGLPIIAEDLIFQVDASNKLGVNIIDTKSMANPSDVGTFQNGLAVVDGVYSLDGIDDYIEFAANPIFDFGTNNFSISCWINSSNLTGFKSIFSLGSYSSSIGVNGIALFTTGSSIELWRTPTGAPPTTVVGSTPSVLSLNTWYNIFLKREGNNAFCYINNIKYTITSGGLSGVSLGNSLDVNWIGRISNGFYFSGLINGMSVYNRSLSDLEVEQNYEALKHNFE